ncbi:Hsp20/alpha crystallin family protein [Eubacteriales bacterium OttesenSCG-928-M02]|nr:Hsp20/alpha crystallin family protein [Eubacteriales bacterium OttesenSCG-928-M02]
MNPYTMLLNPERTSEYKPYSTQERQRSLQLMNAYFWMESHLDEEEDAFTLSVTLPGFEEDDISFEVTDNKITTYATNRFPARQSWDMDGDPQTENLAATYQAGTLAVRFPKRDREPAAAPVAA